MSGSIDIPMAIMAPIPMDETRPQFPADAGMGTSWSRNCMVQRELQYDAPTGSWEMEMSCVRAEATASNKHETVENMQHVKVATASQLR